MRGEGKGICLLTVHHFQEYKQKYLLEERAQDPVFSQSTSGDRVDYLNVEDYIFLSLKHYIKWILINFCFNTWSHCRLSCAFNFQGFCSLKLYVDVGRREGAIESYRTWKLSTRRICSQDTVPQPSQMWQGSHTSAFCHLYNQKDPQELSCWLDGCIIP